MGNGSGRYFFNGSPSVHMHSYVSENCNEYTIPLSYDASIEAAPGSGTFIQKVGFRKSYTLVHDSSGRIIIAEDSSAVPRKVSEWKSAMKLLGSKFGYPADEIDEITGVYDDYVSWVSTGAGLPGAR